MKPHGTAGAACGHALLLSLVTLAATQLPLPTERQVAWQSTPLRTFHHFGICTFAGCEHNSGSGSWGSGPASSFNPTQATDPEQWVVAAKALGAGGAVLTARHEGGFCLFPSRHSNYTIAQSPMAGRDLVREFVDACVKHGLKPSLYFAASCDGWHKNGDPLSPDDYVARQLAMLSELLTTYTGLEYIWFDHHGNPPGHTASPHCDFGSGCICDPYSNSFWHEVDALVRRVAPSVLIGGIDLHIGPTDAAGVTLANHFYACNVTDPNSTANTATRCRSPVAGDSPFGEVYRPTEITSSAANKGWFWHPGSEYLEATQVASDYFKWIGSGYSRILNWPPNATGLLDVAAVAAMQGGGDLIRAFFGSEVARTSGVCESGGRVSLSLPANMAVGAVLLAEDLTRGQRVTNYRVSLPGQAWKVEDQSIGGRRIHPVTGTGSVTSIVLECLGVVGSANITVAAFEKTPA